MATVPLPRHRFTVDEFHRMVNAGIFGEEDRVGLLEGEIVEMPPVNQPHISYVDRRGSASVPLDPSPAPCQRGLRSL